MSYHLELFGKDREALKLKLRERQYGAPDAQGNPKTYGPPAHEVDSVCSMIDKAPTEGMENKAFHVKMSGSHYNGGGNEQVEVRVVESA